MKKLLAEFIGTMWLVFGGCGSAVLAAGVENIGIGLVGVSLAFGLTVVTGAYALGHISGAHFNPAVSIGLLVGGRMPAKDLVPYIVAQILGAIAGAGILYLIVSNGSSFGGFMGSPGEFATNFYDSPVYGTSYNATAAFLTEAFLTFIFLIVILGATHSKAPKGFAGIAIGLALTLIHLISIPVTNTSVNPARSISQAVFVWGDSISQLWLFLVAPVVGAVLAGLVYKTLSPETNQE